MRSSHRIRKTAMHFAADVRPVLILVAILVALVLLTLIFIVRVRRLLRIRS